MEDRIKEIEKASPILQVAVELGLEPRGGTAECFRCGGRPRQGPPALFFDVARNSFLCRQCSDVGGGVIELVCQVNGWDRDRAVEWLAHRLDFDRRTRAMYAGKGRKK